MRPLRLTYFFTAFLLLLSFQQTFARIYASEEISYTCLGNNRYRITLTTYGECGTLAEDQPLENIIFFSEELGIEDNLNLNLQSSNEISIFCESQTTKCNGGTARGLVKNVYSGILTLPEESDDWIVSFQGQYMSDEITTVNKGGLDIAYYTYALINNENGRCNSSPVFNNTPIYQGIVGQELNIDIDINDTDENRYEYSLETILKGENDPVNYSSSFSATRPVSVNGTASINDEGEFSLTPTQADQSGLVDVEVREYDDNGTLISVVRQGVQINTFDSENEPPIVVGGEFNLSVCEGTIFNNQELQEFKFYDPDGDRFSVNILETPEGGRLGLNSVSGDTLIYRLSWFASSALVGTTQELIVELRDQACPVPQTQTLTFTYTVVERTTVELPADAFKNCNDTEVVTPVVSGGTPEYSYTWISRVEDATGKIPIEGDSTNNSDLSISNPGVYSVIVTDSNGCSAEDEVRYSSAVTVNIDWAKYCFGLETDFADSSVVRNGATITSWEWDFGDGDGSTEQNPSHLYGAVGPYDVTLTIQDDQGCTRTQTEEIFICDHPDLSIIRDDSCTLAPAVNFYDVTNYLDKCGVFSRQWEIRDSLGTLLNPSVEGGPLEDSIPPNLLLQYPWEFAVSGTYDVMLRVRGQSGCIDTVTEQYEIHTRPTLISSQGDRDPQLASLNAIAINCDNPDTLLSAILAGPDSIGTPNLTYRWRFATDILETGNIDTPEWEDSLNYVADEVGTYVVTAIDDMGCHDSVNIIIYDPTTVSFKYSNVCEPGEEMRFQNNSTAGPYEIESYRYEFGDGESSTEENPTHTYDISDRRDHQVRLTVTSSVGCVESGFITTKETYNIGGPNLSQDPVCLNDQVELTSAQMSSTNHIDTLIWEFEGSDSVLYYSGSSNGGVDAGRTVDKTYTQEGDFYINHGVRFNRDIAFHIDPNSYCEVNFTEDVFVNPQLLVRDSSARRCIRDSTYLEVIQVAGGAPLDNVNWEIRRDGSGDVLASKEGQSIKYVFPESGLFRVSYLATDEIGCTASRTIPIDIAFVEKPTLTVDDTVCADEEVSINLFVNDRGLEGGRAESYVFYAGNDVITSGFITSSTRDPSTPYEPIGPGNYTFGGLGGSNSVRLVIEPRSEQLCRSILDTTIYTYGLENLSFTTDSDQKCSEDDTVHFEYEPDSNVTSITWAFDDTVYTVEDPRHVFSDGGNQPVKLTVETTEGCTLPYDTTIYVKDKPKADFTTGDENGLVKDVQIPFVDNTDLDGQIISVEWDFGDGSPPTNDFFPFHEYDSVMIYMVTYIVVADNSCADTVTKRVDLNTYLQLPNAFTPNGDGLNDDIGLISKAIQELYSFKIYNRWGELVFDAGDDVTARWDGRYKGVPQELGVYVVHVEGLGAYGKEFNFKTELTLLR